MPITTKKTKVEKPTTTKRKKESSLILWASQDYDSVMKRYTDYSLVSQGVWVRVLKVNKNVDDALDYAHDKVRKHEHILNTIPLID